MQKEPLGSWGKVDMGSTTLECSYSESLKGINHKATIPEYSLRTLTLMTPREARESPEKQSLMYEFSRVALTCMM
ncbi:hypothetical protein E2C01_037824 [Portunus trituberculatus]|uniref:Uncharacterized protein n=1 Tax=Portunus trituberculatus TaxID=210409 RepID=A0A5B7F952_PORTR|nr:hypothetical protein [Portunus trituberculatus]